MIGRLANKVLTILGVRYHTLTQELQTSNWTLSKQLESYAVMAAQQRLRSVVVFFLAIKVLIQAALTKEQFDGQEETEAGPADVAG